MKPPRFRYLDPATLDDALGLLGGHGDEAKLLSGGQSLMPMLSMRLAYPSVVVDLNGVRELDYIRRDNGRLSMGALTRHSAAEDSHDVRGACPLIAKAIPYIGHRAIRNRGTLGGSLAHADPAAELPAVMTALDASVTVSGPRGDRSVAVSELFEMPLVARIDPDEIITAITVQAQPDGAGSAVVEVARRHGDFALVGVAASVCVDSSGHLADVRIACFGAGSTPLRLRQTEEALTGAEPSEGAVAEAATCVAREVDPSDDIHASADYRRSVAEVLVRRALRAAIDESIARARAIV
jgi:aerobic carbon-monoxide dehydrogenase medium subunit